ncbi:MAG TPA: Lrp/AsnC family transcriptional regulator [archaeon]|nr:Lrp/AsnC family transcriptional regulator [archaeon]
MDIVDIKILELLKDNSRMSFNEISQVVGKTEATVRRRVKKLYDDHIIKKFTIEYMVDNKPRTSATVKVEPDFKDIKRILKELLEIEEITNIWRLSGDCGIFMKVEIASIENFNPLIEEKISQVRGVKIVETCFITSIIK